MWYFWLLDGESQWLFWFYYQPGQENLGDYPSKHHSADIHQHVHPYYVHMDNSPTFFLEQQSLVLSEGLQKL